jgi:hypothetical protein
MAMESTYTCTYENIAITHVKYIHAYILYTDYMHTYIYR